MINFIDCVRRFAPALPLRGTSLWEDGLHEATDAVLTQHHNQPIFTVWASIRNSPGLHLKNRRNLSKVQGQLTADFKQLTGLLPTEYGYETNEHSGALSAAFTIKV